jgi:hypothetical protein
MIYLSFYLIICILASLICTLVSDELVDKEPIKIGLAIVLWPLFVIILIILGLAVLFSLPIYLNNND